MSDKKQSKQVAECNFKTLIQQLEQLQKSEKTEIYKLSDVFGRVQDVKSIKSEEIERLFNESMKIAQKDSWKFILEVYSRFYSRKKVKAGTLIVSLLEKEIKDRLKAFIDSEEINVIVSSIYNETGFSLFQKKLINIEEFCKENNYSKCELIVYLYLILLISSKKMYPSDNKNTIILERVFFSKFAEADEHDPFFVKSIKKYFFDDKYPLKFKELTYLYDGVDEELKTLRFEKERKQATIINQMAEIKELSGEITNLNGVLLEKEQLITDKNKEIEDLKQLVSKVDNRNEYNENLYKQQFLDLKRNLVEKLKKDLQLEIEGLEDIADTLNDVQKVKIQRRIDRIYKILQKIGE